jgi:hypothetical protein
MIDMNQVKESDLWYVIGYIAADGHLSIDGRHINITSKDSDHLHLIKKALFLNSKIALKYRGNDKILIYAYLQFSDVKFYRYLLNLGFIQQKSLNLGSVRVDRIYFKDFLRGVIDGDGHLTTWIHKSNLHSQWVLGVTSASKKFILWLQKEILDLYNLEGKVYEVIRSNRVNPVYKLKFGKKAAKIILRDIYYPCCLSLERKFLKVQFCLQESGKMLN